MILKIDQIFATHTILRVGKSDNDPPFTSDEIKVYMEEKEIKHSQITPLGPQANSEAENVMKLKLAKGSLSIFVKLSSYPSQYKWFCSI